jgi:hypothetical protein
LSGSIGFGRFRRRFIDHFSLHCQNAAQQLSLYEGADKMENTDLSYGARGLAPTLPVYELYWKR